MLCNTHINYLGRLTLDWIDSTLNPFLFLVNIEYLDASKPLSIMSKIKVRLKIVNQRFDTIYDLIQFLVCHHTLVPYFLLLQF